MKRRIISMILLAALLLGVFPAGALAAEETRPAGDGLTRESTADGQPGGTDGGNTQDAPAADPPPAAGTDDGDSSDDEKISDDGDASDDGKPSDGEGGLVTPNAPEEDSDEAKDGEASKQAPRAGEEAAPQAGAVATVQIGDGEPTEHDSLPEAWQAAKDASAPATVTLLADCDITRTLTVDAGNDITFSGGEFSIRKTRDSDPVDNADRAIGISGGTLTIADGTIISADDDGIGLSTGGTLRITGGIVKTSGDRKSAVYVGGGVFEMSAGSVLGVGEGTINGLFIDGGTFRISGGIFSSGSGGNPIKIRAGVPSLGNLLLNYASGGESATRYAYYKETAGGGFTAVENMTSQMVLPSGTYKIDVCPGHEYNWEVVTVEAHQGACMYCGHAKVGEHEENENRVCTVCGAAIGAPEASVTIGSETTRYLTFGDAWTAAQEGSSEDTPATVTLLSQVYISDGALSMDYQDNIILEGNGHGITSTRGYSVIQQQYGTLTIHGGTFSSSNTSYGTVYVGSDAVLNIQDGIFTNSSNVALEVSVDAKVNLSGGSFQGNGSAIGCDKPSDLLCNYANPFEEERYAFYRVEGGTETLIINPEESLSDSSVVVKACSDHAAGGLEAIDAVYHGTRCKACGYAVTSAEHTIVNGECTGCQGKIAAAVTAADGSEKEYLSLQEAFRAAETEESATVTLRSDVQLEEPLEMNGGNITLNGGAFTVSTAFSDYFVAALEVHQGSLTIESGTISASSGSRMNVGILCVGDVTLRMNGGTVSASSESGMNAGIICEGDVTLRMSGGTVSASGGAESYGAAFVGTTLDVSGGTIRGVDAGIQVRYVERGQFSGGTFQGAEPIRFGGPDADTEVIRLLDDGYIYYDKENRPVSRSHPAAGWNADSITVKACPHEMQDGACVYCGFETASARVQVEIDGVTTLYASIYPAWDAATEEGVLSAKITLLKLTSLLKPLVMTQGDIELTCSGDDVMLQDSFGDGFALHVAGGKLRLRNCSIHKFFDAETGSVEHSVLVSGGTVEIENSHISISGKSDTPDLPDCACYGLFITGDGSVKIKSGSFSSDIYNDSEGFIGKPGTAIAVDQEGAALGDLLDYDPAGAGHLAYYDSTNDPDGVIVHGGRESASLDGSIAVKPCSGETGITTTPENHTFACMACGLVLETDAHTFSYRFDEAARVFLKECAHCGYAETYAVSQSETPLTLAYGESGTLEVAADPDLAAFTYQWSDSDGPIPGADAARYALPADLADGEHSYSCKVTLGDAEGVFAFTVRVAGKDAPHRVTFRPNGGSGAAPEQPDAFAGETFELPENPFTRAGYVFGGWSFDGALYQPGDRFEMPDRDVTFTAQWTPVLDMTGMVVDANGDPVPGATVTLQRGTQTVAELTTDAEGRFLFANVAAGLYNLRVEKDGIVKTVRQEVESESVAVRVVLPDGKMNSVVEVAAGAPPVVVGGLDEMFQDETVFTEADAEIVRESGTVEFKMTVEQKEEPSEAAPIEAAKKPEEQVGLYLDLTLTKTVTESGGAPQESRVTEVKNQIETVVSLPAELQNKERYAVYRVHEGVVEALPEGSAGDAGEYFTVSGDKQSISIFGRKYSVYAIAYVESGETPPEPEKPEPEPEKPEPPKRPSTSPGAIHDSSSSRDPEPRPTKPAPKPEEDPHADCPSQAFRDLDGGEWYHEAVDFALETGLMSGTNAGFAPGAPLSRAMLAQILWNHAGRPSAPASGFPDVPAGEWFADAVGWAASAGVVSGYSDGRFAPYDGVTREQFAVMLWRYAGSPAGTGALDFRDAALVSDYAADALRWAVGEGILTGKSGNRLDPQGQTTRAEAAQMLYQYLK